MQKCLWSWCPFPMTITITQLAPPKSITMCSYLSTIYQHAFRSTVCVYIYIYILVYIYIFNSIDTYLRPQVLFRHYTTIIRQRNKDFGEIENIKKPTKNKTKQKKKTAKRMFT